LLKEILKQVQVSNQKVESLEKEVQDLKQAGTSNSTHKRKKVAPSPEVRVSMEFVHLFFL
jgi:cell shape-determining protein MreC